ncbi:MAG: zinc ribbon domain-containing protein [Actinomycetales bacterium]|nr:zinc ribbon domain-containing protein [Actinomycetales bacterium]
MTFCPQCGTQRAEGAQFCGKCGTPANATAAPAAPAAPAYGAPAYGAYGEQIPTIVTLALVFAFISPLVGLILAYVGKAQALATGPLSVKRNSLALTLSWIFMALGIVFWIVYAIVMASIATSYGSYY